MSKSIEDILVQRGTTAANAEIIASQLQVFISERQRDSAEQRCSPMEAYEAIEAKFSEFGLSMHDLVVYPDKDTWQDGYNLISAVISDCRNRDELPPGRYWVVDDRYGEKAHGLHVDSFLHVTDIFLRKLEIVLQQNIPDWQVMISSNTDGENYRMQVTANGTQRLSLTQ